MKIDSKVLNNWILLVFLIHQVLCNSVIEDPICNNGVGDIHQKNRDRTFHIPNNDIKTIEFMNQYQHGFEIHGKYDLKNIKNSREFTVYQWDEQYLQFINWNIENQISEGVGSYILDFQELDSTNNENECSLQHFDINENFLIVLLNCSSISSQIYNDDGGEYKVLTYGFTGGIPTLLNEYILPQEEYTYPLEIMLINDSEQSFSDTVIIPIVSSVDEKINILVFDPYNEVKIITWELKQYLDYSESSSVFFDSSKKITNEILIFNQQESEFLSIKWIPERKTFERKLTRIRRTDRDILRVSDEIINDNGSQRRNILKNFNPQKENNQDYQYCFIQTNNENVVFYNISGREIIEIFSTIDTDGKKIHSFSLYEEYNENIDDYFLYLSLGIPERIQSSTSRGSLVIYRNEFSNNNSDYKSFMKLLEISDEDFSIKSFFGSSVSFLDHKADSGLIDILISAPSPFNIRNFQLYKYNLSNQPHCIDCKGVLFGSETLDLCGECGGNNESCFGCDGERESHKENDYCGECGGDHSKCSYVDSIEISDSLGLKEKFYINRSISIIPSNTIDSSSISSTYIDYEIPKPLCKSYVTNIKFNVFPTDRRMFWEWKQGDYINHENDIIHCMSKLDGCNIKPHEDTFAGSILWTLKRQLLSSDKISTIFINVRFFTKECPGCDGLYSGKVEDSCGICGGDDSTCHDCANILNGTHIVDECNNCINPITEKPSCLIVEDMPDIWLRCNEKRKITYTPEYRPLFHQILNTKTNLLENIDNNNIKWTLRNRTLLYNRAYIHRDGTLEYEVVKKINTKDTLIYKATDKYKNVAYSTLNIYIEGCDVIGCDGNLGSGLEYDNCQICGGDNQCFDCAGIKNGQHKIHPLSGECILGLDLSQFVNHLNVTDDNNNNNDDNEENQTSLSKDALILIILGGSIFSVVIIGGIITTILIFIR